MTRLFLPAGLVLSLLLASCGDDGGSGGDASTDGAGSDGGVGSSCTYTDDCAAGLYCAPNRTCQPAGSGGSGTTCALDGDCERGLVCDSVGGTLQCVTPGPGDLGDSCATVADCRAGLFCVESRCSATSDGPMPDGGAPDGTTGDGGGGDSGVPPPPPTCLAYCGLVVGNCEDAAQYGSFAECMSHCEMTGGWSPGENGDTSGNTIACRVTYAERAGADDTNCAAAGPSGGNVCGTWCDVYCAQVNTNCVGGNAITFDPDCATECAAHPAGAPAISVSGDSVQCRIYHSGIPAGSDPGTHCPHAAPDGGGVCVDPP